MPELAGHLDQNGLTLRVVINDGRKAELPNQGFYALRVKRVLTWIPPSHVHLGQAQYNGQSYPATFKTWGNGQNSSVEFLQQGELGFTVARTGSNIGGPFLLPGDVFDLSGMQPGFTVLNVQPSYPTYVFQPGIYCDQVSGGWGMHWPKVNLLKADAESCYKQGSTTSSYGFNVTVEGPKGVNPWPANAQ